ncbi:multiheme c-type cytochrome [Geopsychrobacter electrodiphilus]|uniref:multiheme c-type cytochrome n=1 Tax=Geopsychrobacter electrodiphilus TaxID=225196 RepID=UPI000365B1AE|nr:hypothetical protein [Geopsychrobacter electrodiphilus]
MKKLKLMLLLGLIALVAGLSGCASDGSNGAAGAPGAPGATGPAGPVTQTNESCAVCHSAGAIADIGAIHTTDAPLTVTVDDVRTVTTGTNKFVEVDFTAMNGTQGVTGLDTKAANFYLADIVPAGTNTTVSGTWPTAYLERWAYEGTGKVVGTLTAGATAGTYTYTFGTPYTDGTFTAALAGTSHGGDPLAAESLATVAPEFSIYGDTQRVVIKVGADSTSHYAGTVAVQDFTVADSGAIGTADAITTVLPDRVLAPVSGCKQCHSDNMQNAAHASSYPDTRVCNTCHSPISNWPHSASADGTGLLEGGVTNSYGQDITRDGMWLSKFVHQIHSNNVWAFNATPDVTYPENIKNCAKCHNGDDNMSTAWNTNPSGEACASCHSGNVINADGTMTHDTANYASAPTGNYADTAGGFNVCAGCHPSAAIISAHTVTTLKNAPTVSITPVYTSAITLAGATGASGEFLAGDVPVVTVTATKGGVAMSTADFTAAKLYVYGPRSKALPILTPGSSTDPAYDPATAPTQGVNLLDTTDANVTVDATDLKYTLQAIPSTLEAGTYMAMVYVTDPSSRNIPTSYGGYNLDGWQLINFQVGTATVQPRVAGDGCNKCHDLNDWTSTAHRAYFGTDGCLACHDQSGNHADTIANRVHAVHSATLNGDLNNRDWTEITYPSALTNCAVCHNSTSKNYMATSDTVQPSQWAKPCIGCHGDVPGAKDHMIQNGGPL